MPRVLIVDDHEIVREGVRRILEMQQDWEICGEASNGRDALRLNSALKPDVIIMDITMPGMSGLEVTQKITSDYPGSKILIFTMHEPPKRAAIERSGAKGLLSKSRATRELTPALNIILGGRTYFD